MKKNRLASMLLVCFAFMIFITPLTPTADPDFSDIKGHWAEDYISSLSSAGYIKGYLDGMFRPDNTMSKAEFSTALMVCMGASASDTTTSNYSDTSTHWARGYINEAVKRGVLIPSEDPNGLQPNDGIMRSQAAAMMVRALGKQPDNGLLSFKDAATVEKSMYKGYIKTAYDLGLISGFPNGNFEPFTKMTRAQVCTVLCKFVKQLGGTSAVTPTATTTGSINAVVIGDQTYNINSTPVYFRINFNDVRASSISQSTQSILLNNTYPITLNSYKDNPDIVIGNIRYGVEKYSADKNTLIVDSECRKIHKLIINGYTYNSDYVDLYINAASTDYFLSDLEITDRSTVRVGTNTYKLSKDRISISVNDKQYFYDIEEIDLGDTDTTPKLTKCDPLVFDGLSISDITAIFSGYTTLDLGDLDDLAFIIDGKRYSLGKVEIDASGNFTVNDEIYSPDEVIMTSDDLKYDIEKITIQNNRFIFYCGEGTEQNWVIVDDEYYDSDNVKILWNSTIYDYDSILVVNRNLIRINRSQYEVDDNFKCRVDGKVYYIDEIEHDRNLGVDVIETGDTSSSSLTNQPESYIFYCDNRQYQKGLNDVTIKASSKWLDFEDVIILDPTHFNYNSSEYKLIGANIKIGNVDFEIEDTAWHGLDQTLDIYLEEI